jgi:flagellar hook-associated protein 3 FlgL
MVFVSGDRKMNLVINDEADLTLEAFATRLRAAAGDWLDVVVQKEPEISGVDAHSESESSRLVITTKDGAPLSVYDKTNAYARKMGLSSGLVTKDLTGIAFPPTPASDVPALIGIEVGGKLHRVALLKEDVTDGSGNIDPQKLSEQIRHQVGSDVIGVDLVEGDTSLALYSKTGEPMRVIDLPYADPSQGGRSSGLAVETGLHAGITGELVDEALQPGAPGRFVVETGGRRLEVPVAATDTLEDIASKLRELAVGWLDVSVSADGANRRMALAAGDGAPLNVYDLTGDAAETFGINTDIRIQAGAGALPVNNEFAIDVDGYSVDIDLTDITDLEGLAAHINARFGGRDIRAEVVDNAGTDELVLLSPRGKSVTVTDAGGLTLPDGTTSPLRSAAEEPGPYAQMVTTRTGADVEQGDLFALLEDLVPAIEQGDTAGLSDSFLPRLDVAMDDVLSARATCGALRRRYETALSRLKDDNLAMTDLYSGIMDVDIAEAAVEFQTAQMVYQATLATISKVVQPTLVDYLT